MDIRVLTELDEFRAVQRLFDEIWQPEPANPPITADIMRALTMAGNYVAGAYDETGLIGACAAFFGPPAERELHSHIAGVTAAATGRGVGRAIKLHQRDWALSRGVEAITWTFDPLVSRNAYFNLVKLGGTPVRYLTNWYGSMNDGINGDDETDRLLLRWDLLAAADSQVLDAAALRASGAAVGLDRSDEGAPLPGTSDGDTVLVAVPRDIETLRRADPACARRWRVAVREVLAPLLTDGFAVAGFDRSGWYVLRKADR